MHALIYKENENLEEFDIDWTKNAY